MDELKKRGRPVGIKKTGGRKVGTPNKVTSNLRQAVNDLIDANWDTIQTDLRILDPKDRLSFLEKMMAYALPKLSSTNIDAIVETSSKIDQMNSEQLNKLIDSVLNEDYGRIKKTTN